MGGWVFEVWSRERDGWFMKLMKLKKGAKLRCLVLSRKNIFYIYLLSFYLGNVL